MKKIYIRQHTCTSQSIIAKVRSKQIFFSEIWKVLSVENTCCLVAHVAGTEDMENVLVLRQLRKLHELTHVVCVAELNKFNRCH